MPRSRCPISLSLDLLGDKWTLLIIRDLMFTERRSFNELKAGEEGISANVLADRLQKLVEVGLVWRSDDPGHRQKVVYRLTEAGIDLLPVIIEIGAWGRHHLPVTPESEAPAKALELGGKAMRESTRRQLLADHLSSPSGPPVGPVPAIDGDPATGDFGASRRRARTASR